MRPLFLAAVWLFTAPVVQAATAERSDGGSPREGHATAARPDGGNHAPWLHPAAGADAGLVRFIAVGDTGTGDEGQRAVGAAMAKVCLQRGCDFVVLLGDNVYPSGVSSASDPHWRTAFVEPYAGVKAPFFAALGNHDYGDGGHGWQPAQAEAQVAYSRVNPRWVMPATHYAFSWGPVDFFAADTTRTQYGLDQQVRADFGTWLPASTATWKVAFGHHALVSNGQHGNAGSYRGNPDEPSSDGAAVKAFLEETVCGQADLYLCGHDHTLQWLKGTCRGTELIVSGGGAKSDGLRGKNPAYFEADQLGFLYVTLDGRSLTGEFYAADGGVLYGRTLEKRDAGRP